MSKGLNSNGLKIMAIISMLVDHIGYTFYPHLIWLRIIGRIAFPIFAYFIAVGYEKTENKRKYLIRLLIFAVISQYPYSLFAGVGLFKELNIFFTLSAGLAAIWCMDNKNEAIRIIVPLSLAVLCEILNSDYGMYGVALIIIFHKFKDIKPLTTAVIALNAAFFLLAVSSGNSWQKSLVQSFSITALVPIFIYNSEKGSNSFKWLFYTFYPLHLAIIFVINSFIS